PSSSLSLRQTNRAPRKSASSKPRLSQAFFTVLSAKSSGLSRSSPRSIFSESTPLPRSPWQDLPASPSDSGRKISSATSSPAFISFSKINTSSQTQSTSAIQTAASNI